MPPEVFGVSVAEAIIAAALGQASTGLPEPAPVPSREAIEALDGRCSGLAWVERVMAFGCTVVPNRDALAVLAA